MGSELKFNGSSGRKPQAEARRYVYRMLSTVLDLAIQNGDGWLFDNVEREPDQRRLLKAVHAVRKELEMKGAR
jgi:hypothetical protein